MICPVSPWTEGRARQSRILKDFAFQTVFNGVNTDIFFRTGSVQRMEERPVVLSVTAHFSAAPEHPKGGWYLMELARRMPHVTFLVAGPAEAPADCPENLVLLDMIADQQKLAQLYRQADLTVLTSRRETFSLPCAESLCCGTPVVGFQAGAPEQIALPEYSEFVAFGCLEALEAAVGDWLNRKDLNREEVARAAARRYSAETMVDNFMDVYRRILWN